MSLPSISADSVAGPRVATIFVLRSVFDSMAGKNNCEWPE